MAPTLADKRARFRALHDGGCFVLPNPWDVGGARLLQHLGFSALATTSAGFAWSMGRTDQAMARDDVLAHLTSLCASVDLPVNADFESGFAPDPEGVAANVVRAIETGVAGLSIEDLDTPGHLHDAQLSIDRIRAARAAIDESGEDVVLVARTEGLLYDPRLVTQSIEKLMAYAEAGADCLYAPGVSKPEDIAAMVRAVAPKPLNVLATRPDWTVAALADLGVRRISVGGGLARVAWGAVLKAAEAMKAGSFEGLAEGAPRDVLNAAFGKAR